MHWLLAGYIWLYIHRPFEIWPQLAELRVERVYMLFTLAVWLCSPHKGWFSNALTRAFAAFLAAVVLAWSASPYADAGARVIEDLVKIGVFYVLVLSCIRDEQKLRFLVNAFLIVMSLYMVHSLREYLNGRHVYRMGTARMIGVDTSFNDPNTLGASLVYALPMVLPLVRTATTLRERLPALGFVGLTTVCVLLTGSRTAIVGLLGLFALVALVSRQRLRIAVTAAVLLPLAWWVLPEDRQNRYLTIVDSSYGPENAKESADSRHEFFTIACELWKQQPLLGYGPGSFPQASGTNMQAHTLYGQLLAEVGVVGIIPFLAVLASFIANARAMRRICQTYGENEVLQLSRSVSDAVMVVVAMLLVLGLGGHNLYRFTWVWYGAFQVVALHVARRSLTDIHEPLSDEILESGEPLTEVPLLV